MYKGVLSSWLNTRRITSRLQERMHLYNFSKSSIKSFCNLRLRVEHLVYLCEERFVEPVKRLIDSFNVKVSSLLESTFTEGYLWQQFKKVESVVADLEIDIKYAKGVKE